MVTKPKLKQKKNKVSQKKKIKRSKKIALGGKKKLILKHIVNVPAAGYTFNTLVLDIGKDFTKSKTKLIKSINVALVRINFFIGKAIFFYEQSGSDRAEYGSKLIIELSKALTLKYGKGFGVVTLASCLKFYLLYSNLYNEVSKKLELPQLSWSHITVLLSVKADNERIFYEERALASHWSVRELRRQKASKLYDRSALTSSGDPKALFKKDTVSNPRDIILDSYCLEFIGNKDFKKESELEQALVDNIVSFLRNLGKGFAFVDRQKRIVLEGRSYFIDLVFYNYLLGCFVLIDLKVGDISHKDLGQMLFYKNYYDMNEIIVNKTIKPTIGLVLGASKSTILVETTLKNESHIFAAEYHLFVKDLEIDLKSKLDSILR